MAWVAVDEDKTESIFEVKPQKGKKDRWWPDDEIDHNWVELPKGTVKKLIGRELTWNDDPVQLK